MRQIVCIFSDRIADRIVVWQRLPRSDDRPRSRCPPHPCCCRRRRYLETRAPRPALMPSVAACFNLPGVRAEHDYHPSEQRLRGQCRLSKTRIHQPAIGWTGLFDSGLKEAAECVTNDVLSLMKSSSFGWHVNWCARSIPKRSAYL